MSGLVAFQSRGGLNNRKSVSALQAPASGGPARLRAAVSTNRQSEVMLFLFVCTRSQTCIVCG